MLHKSLLLSIVLCACVGVAAVFISSQCQQCRVSQPENVPDSADSISDLPLSDGEWGTVYQSEARRIVVNANETRSGVDNYTQVSFLVNYSESDVKIKLTFSNVPFTAQSKLPGSVSEMSAFYLKVETTKSEAISGVSVTLRYNQSRILFTERALWIFSYDPTTGTWSRIPTTVDYDADIVTFQMPSGAGDPAFELSLYGQETRGMEFPLWAWFLILPCFGIIIFMAVGEIVYHSYIRVELKGTDGRVKVALKRFFGAWGRKFTQLNDKVGEFLDYYENATMTVPPVPPEKPPNAVSSLGHVNRIGLEEGADLREEDYQPIESDIRPTIIAQTADKNPLAKAIFQESQPEKSEEPGEEIFTPYIPAAVRTKMVEKPPQKSAVGDILTETPTKKVPVKTQTKSASKSSPPPELKAVESNIPPDLLQETKPPIIETPASNEVTKVAKKAPKKTTKKVAKKAVKKSAGA